jgi:hypothetical protein
MKKDDRMPLPCTSRSIPSTKSSSRNTPTSPWSVKSVSVVKKVADFTDLSLRFFISASVSDRVVPAMQ